MTDYAKIAEELKAAKVLIEDPAHWVQGMHGADANGAMISSSLWHLTPPACMCSVGALHKVQMEAGTSRDILDTSASPAKLFLDAYVPDTSIESFNDFHPHASVMACWDRAIAEAERLAAQGA